MIMGQSYKQQCVQVTKPKVPWVQAHFVKVPLCSYMVTLNSHVRMKYAQYMDTALATSCDSLTCLHRSSHVIGQ